MKKIRKAVIAAAGFGTRFLPQTKAMPKEMLPLVDKPIVQYVVEELVEAGIEDIVIVTGYHKRSIEDHFDQPSTDLIKNLEQGGESKRPLLEEVKRISEMANIVYVRQKGPYGNGTPLLNAEHLIGDEPFIYTWSDDFIASEPGEFKQLIAVYEKYQTPVLATISVSRDEDYKRYGFVGGNALEPGVLEATVITEKPGKEAAPSNLATVSGFILTPETFTYLHKALTQKPENSELYYNDALKLMLEDGKRIVTCEVKNGRYYDTGNKLGYIKAVIDFALEDPTIGQSVRDYIRNLTVGS